ncbi:MAG TPA: DUF2848 family protein [Iamia sp.]|nr:DUF2848 family protein [Iamia sp.]
MNLDAVVVAGYTGRDRAHVLEHIEELAAIGVPRPEAIPAYFVLPPMVATTADEIVVAGDQTSGEAEVCLLVDGDDVRVTLASDHTDRAAEALDIGLSKGACPTPIATDSWPLADVDGRWDDLVLRSWITVAGEEVPYQDGRCADLIPPPDLLAGAPPLAVDRFALLTGTVPVIGGIRPADAFRAELHDPGRDRSIHLSYSVSPLRRS